MANNQINEIPGGVGALAMESGCLRQDAGCAIGPSVPGMGGSVPKGGLARPISGKAIMNDKWHEHIERAVKNAEKIKGCCGGKCGIAVDARVLLGLKEECDDLEKDILKYEEITATYRKMIEDLQADLRREQFESYNADKRAGELSREASKLRAVADAAAELRTHPLLYAEAELRDPSLQARAVKLDKALSALERIRDSRMVPGAIVGICDEALKDE